jgi:mannan endo-1,4-beta-mannosidase
LPSIGLQTGYKQAHEFEGGLFLKNKNAGAPPGAKPKTPVRVNPGSIMAAGQTQKVQAEIKLVDGKARDFTVKLAAYLKAIGKTDCVLFGHQNDITHKAGSKSLSSSDTKDMTGSIAAVVGLDTLSLTGDELASAAWNMPLEERVEAVRQVAVEAAGQGAIITLSAHMPNFDLIDQRVKMSREGTEIACDSGNVGILSDGRYNFSGYTTTVTTGGIVRRIMPGGDLNYLYLDYMDMVAACAKALETDNISVLFRPFHECTGSWFWWGRDFCGPEEYKDMFRYTVEYLRDIKGVHNFIYVYGPGSEAKNTSEYAIRYPGDDYADMVGFDMYHTLPAVNDKFIDSFKKQLNIVQQFAREHGKLFAVTETGVSNKNLALLKTGNARKDWFKEILDAVSPTDASYFLVWANFGENSTFYTPYVTRKTGKTTIGHEMLGNFIDFYNDPRSVFAAQMGDYTKLSVTTVQS